MDKLNIEWVQVSGGICRFGDRAVERRVKPLFCSKTLLSEAHFHPTGSHFPKAQTNFFEALEIAKKFDARLPTSTEWEWIAAGETRRKYPWGDSRWDAERANILDSGIDGPTEVLSYPKGATPEGVQDMAGNLWEWTTSQTEQDGRVIRGGSYNSKQLYATCRFLNAAPAEIRSPGIGIRLVRDSD